MAQRLRIHLPVQGTRSIPGRGRAYMPRSNSACVPQLLSLLSRAQGLQLLKPPQGEAFTLQLDSSPRLLQLEKARTQNRLSSIKINK